MDTEALKTNIKRFFLNPNTATFFLVIVLIVIVYVVYSYMISRAVDMVSIPYAANLLKANHEIVSDDVLSVKVSGTVLGKAGENIIQSRGRIIDFQVADGYQIPKYSFFYKDAITDHDITVQDRFKNLPDGYTMYALKVNFHTTYGNSIMPGNYIDLYFKTYDKEKLIFEEFIKSIRVAYVLDKDYVDVFSNSDDEKEAKPAFLYFEVPDEVFELLHICDEIGQIEIIPVPRNAGYTANPEETRISNKAVEEYIKVRKQEIGY